MTSPRPHPSGASSVLAFISFLSSFRTFLASLALRRAARAEPSLCCRRRGPAARRGRPPSTLQTRFHPAGHSARRGPGPGRPRPGTGHAVTPPHPSTFARSAGSSPARPAGPGAGAVLGRGGVAGPGDREPGREPGTEQRAGEAAPKFASDSPGAAAAPWAEVYFLEKAPGFGLENPTAKIEPSSWSGSESPAENMERMSDSADKPIDNDAEGVWSPDIEQSFQEALAIYPPCGRRKIILSDEGKMYGRNELIARYIKLRTGKTRTRKQVSSHIQVLARKKVREIQAAIKVSSHIQVLARRKSRDFHSKLKYNKHLFVHIGHANHSYSDPLLESVDIRQIYDKFPEKKGGLKELFGKGPQNAFFLVKFWADLNCNIQDDAGAFYGVTSQYESSENMTVTCSTKVCSFGKQVVEKVETEYARFENGRFVYRINRSPMCEYMINFIHKLKHLPEKYMMNSVLENFTILLVVTNRDTQETLLCMACVFEVSNSEHGAQHHIYRLVKD
uniref:TEA domain transcription factor 1 n=1 Tax=Papio anubis TaxID=9555 RepID=A0A2I3MAD5_PAPAN